jgi:hypothetical protein
VYLDASRLLSDAGNWIENRPRLAELGDTAMADPTKKVAATMCDIMQGMCLQPGDPCGPCDPCISQIQLDCLYLIFGGQGFFLEFATVVNFLLLPLRKRLKERTQSSNVAEACIPLSFSL